MIPLIGILASLWAEGDGIHSGDERIFAHRDYITAVHKAGGVPVILPPIADIAAIARQIEAVEGVMLIGGFDVDPLLYGAEPRPQLGPVFPERDEFELVAVTMARLQGKPILGICRGIQVINVACGGTLWQDLSLMGGGLLQHYQKGPRCALGHTVDVQSDTILARIMGQSPFRTNSYHHQAVQVPAPGFIVSACTGDGVIEAIEDVQGAVLGVQWHPEMLLDRQGMLGLFRWLVEASATVRGEIDSVNK
ncbi:MAG: gamma-glutamyl-gamma-aminobutyrate hydrolase family protein [Negativicutes bacterium]|nr:gamma-glutamyl-gamma-aminobutyrate hydrolase family protein [Negativicutes bacterium]